VRQYLRIIGKGLVDNPVPGRNTGAYGWLWRLWKSLKKAWFARLNVA
jgi:hypothetical protein